MTENATSDAQIHELLNALKVHIDEILLSVAEAENESHEQVQARIAQAADATEATTAEVAQKASDASAATVSKWDSFRSSIQSKKDDVSRQIEARSQQHDAKVAVQVADAAEDFAIDAVDFARATIQNAWVAILDAVDARLYAEELAGQLPGPTA
ncbi:hypothetical protein BN12_40024 [Nostocoides japonicum T1-X7]|uniref:Uncharacterized protein n=1 Tax=Nostocoides japonicum T1-X7 TaxID=1194083 RepID=A0A077M4K2_9MICO|nr:hypothetical protein [Tetrasphaera japonica]CCH79054.1 hypothetical protein BN12_40024 [Tetrasphaera japonica T1-X7]